jgi:Tol biopolymer transport system component
MDEQMLTSFEQRLSARLRSYTESAVMPVDAAEITHTVASAHPRTRARWNLSGLRLGLRLAIVAVALVLAVLAAALLAGEIRRSNELGRNGLIAFATDNRIVVANPDGSDVRILTSGAEEAFFPTWSPDGARIAFWSKSSNLAPASLALLDPQTGSRTVVTSLNVQSHPVPILWAPDGQSLAFSAYSEQTTPEVRVVRADGIDLRSVAPQLYASDPAWSPDSSQIAFRGQDPTDVSNVRLYVVGADGTGIRPVVAAKYGYGGSDVAWVGVDLNWSPDGQHIAFGTKGSPSAGFYVIAVADLTTGAIHDLTVGDFDGQPHWSPDGRWIEFGRGHAGNPNSVGLVRPDGSDLRILADVLIAENTASWSPDGTRIIGYTPDLSQVVVIPIDGSTPSTFPAPGANTIPSWQRLP